MAPVPTSVSAPAPSTADYWIGPLIGEGAFSQVHYAKRKVVSDRSDMVVPGVVAIKVIDQATIRRYPAVLSSVLQEQTLLSTTLHESSWVVHLWSSFYDSQCLYLVLELCEGGDLQGLLDGYYGAEDQDEDEDEEDCSPTTCPRKENENIDISKNMVLSFVLAQLHDALDAIHHAPYYIVHCDIKPSNILLKMPSSSLTTMTTVKEGRNDELLLPRIKLADFGSAWIMKTMVVPATTTTTSAEGVVCSNNQSTTSGGHTLLRGTAEYSSPELIRHSTKYAGTTTETNITTTTTTEQEEHYDIVRAMDYWSFGCVAIAMYTGRSPFWRKGSESLAIQAIMDLTRNGQNEEEEDDIKEKNVDANMPSDSTKVQDLFWDELVQRARNHEEAARQNGIGDRSAILEFAAQNPSSFDSSSSSSSSHPLLAFRGLLHAKPTERCRAWKSLLFPSTTESRNESIDCTKNDSSSSRSCVENNGGNDSATIIDTPLILPPPKWKEEVETAEFKDGAWGWGAFFF